MKGKEFSKMTNEELDKKMEELKKDMMKQNAQRASGTMMKNSGQLRNIRRNIARILTVKNKKK
jgi:large subunit ribosomal protein L29